VLHARWERTALPIYENTFCIAVSEGSISPPHSLILIPHDDLLLVTSEAGIGALIPFTTPSETSFVFQFFLVSLSVETHLESFRLTR